MRRSTESRRVIAPTLNRARILRSRSGKFLLRRYEGFGACAGCRGMVRETGGQYTVLGGYRVLQCYKPDETEGLLRSRVLQKVLQGCYSATRKRELRTLNVQLPTSNREMSQLSEPAHQREDSQQA